MLLIPFADVLLPPTADPKYSGELKSTIPVTPVDFLHSTSVSPVNALFLVGDNSSGSVSWSDITDESNDYTANDIPGPNSDGDMFYIALSETDIVESFDFYISTGGVYSGTPTATVYYRSAAGDLVTFSVSRDLSTTGIKRLMFPTVISYDDLGEIDDPRDVSLPRQRAFVIKYSTLGTVTTPCAGLHAWKRRPSNATPRVIDYTALVTDEDKTPWENTNILVFNGSRSVYGSTNKFGLIYNEIIRSRESSWTTKLIYSKADGTFGDLPVDSYIINSASVGDEMETAAAGSYVDIIKPPSDWAKIIMQGDASNRNAYWFGWQYTADAVEPQLITIDNVHIAEFDSNCKGVRAGEVATYTTLELFADKSSSESTWILATNKTTQQTAFVELPANQKTASASINLSVSANDEVVFQVLKGHESLGLADGFIRLV